eukprot:8541664-Karenia_brevis.AAC.1
MAVARFVSAFALAPTPWPLWLSLLRFCFCSGHYALALMAVARFVFAFALAPWPLCPGPICPGPYALSP